MKDTKIEADSDIDADLFSPEELAMMSAANGLVDEVVVFHDRDELQAQYNAVARLIAEGGERERQLRAMVHDLTLLADANGQQQSSLHEQTRTLARLVVTASERELQLKQSLEDFRAVIGRRARTVL